MVSLIKSTHIDACLQANTLTLTSNVRMSSFLKKQLLIQRHQAQPVCETPNCYPLMLWLKHQANQIIFSAEAQFLLSPQMALLKWREIIQSDEVGQNLVRVHQAAKQAYQAYGLVKGWKIPLEELSKTDKIEAKAFNVWMKQYDSWCAKHRFIDPNGLYEYIQKNWQRLEHLHHLETVFFYGFDTVSVQLNEFIEFLQDNGLECETLGLPSSKPENINKYQFSNKEAEYHAAALWAQTQIKQGKATAIVVPDLASDRKLIDRIFKKVFDPEQIYDANPRVVNAYNISTGVPLAQYLIVKSLLLVLQGHQLKDSPFFTNPLSIQAPKEWLTYKEFKDWLYHYIQTSQWPGERTLNSIEYQCVARLYALIDEYAQFDMISTSKPFSSHIQWLVKLCSDLPFQPENKEPKVHILGTLEAAGLHFDGVWITGVYQDLWPMPAEPNPFIDLYVQRQKNLPRSCAKRETEFAKSLLKRFASACHELIFSYPLQVGSEQMLPSALVQDIGSKGFDEKQVTINAAQDRLVQDKYLELFSDYEPIPVTNIKDMAGGSRLLSDYHDCPFKAFAAQRLKVNDIEKPSVGISYLERGIILHKVLEYIYQGHPSQSALTNVDVEAYLDKTFKEYAESLSRVPKPIVYAEKQRLTKLVEQLLNKEQSRGEFTIKALELPRFFKIGKLSLKLRLDRVDSVPEGILLLDYKTGNDTITDWLKFPPSSAQLPLYYMAMQDQPIKAIGVISLTSRGVEYQLIDDTQLESLAPQWTQWLNEMAQDYIEGIHHPVPKNKNICRYCSYASMCRLFDRGL